MVSQCIYVLKVDAFFYNREQDLSSSISTCAYGPIFLVIGKSVLVGGLVVNRVDG